MKFGRTLPHYQIREWAQHYIPYNRLKHAIKLEVHGFKDTEKSVEEVISFEGILRAGVENVARFLEERLLRYREKINVLETLKDEYTNSRSKKSLIGILELLSGIISDLRLLLLFVSQNTTAFEKITKKYKKKTGLNPESDLFGISVFDENLFECLNRYLNEAKEEREKYEAFLIEEEHSNERCILENQNYDKVEDLCAKIDAQKSLNISNFQDIIEKLSLYLLQALINNVTPVVERIFKSVPDILLHFDSRSTLLHKIIAYRPKNENEHLKNGSYSFEINEKALREAFKYSQKEVIKEAMRTRDFEGKTPLHYLIYKNCSNCLELLLKNIEDECQDESYWFNNEYDPLFYLLMSGECEAVKCYIKSNIWNDLNRFPFANKSCSSRSDHASLLNINPLSLSCYMGYKDLVKLLLENGANINFRNQFSETPLHYCCKGRNLDCLKVLLSMSEENFDSIHIRENQKGRTPLFIAAIGGRLEFVALLLERGAQVDITDYSGLNPHENAVFRAHYDVAELLVKNLKEYPKTYSIPQISKRMYSKNFERLEGRKCLADTSRLILTFGSLPGMECYPIDLNAHRLGINSRLDMFTLKISISGSSESDTITFPLSNIVEQVSFDFSSSEKTVLVEFSLQSCIKTSVVDQFSQEIVVIGTAEALVSRSISNPGYVQAPIKSSKGSFIGKITFRPMIIDPLINASFFNDKKFTWNAKEFKLIGHRGLGMNQTNISTSRRLQLTENTLLSFMAAGVLGAQYVEFDVQLTEDLVPVIYHDFKISQFPIPIPVSCVKAKEFEEFSQNLIQKYLNRNPSRKLKRTYSDSELESLEYFTAPSKELQGESPAPLYGGGVRILKVNLPFTTLEKSLKNVPIKVGFNIEIKYPNMQQVKFYKLNPIDLNTFVDAILRIVSEHGKERKIYFSSFNSDICTTLCLKQKAYPVLYLTSAGRGFLRDIHDISVYSAVRFARDAGCIGIVSLSTPFLLAPNLIHNIRESGMFLITYGLENSIPENAMLLKNYGIDGIITDRVPELHKFLRENRASKNAVKMS